jgi:hypothetical protein
MTVTLKFAALRIRNVLKWQIRSAEDARVADVGV